MRDYYDKDWKDEMILDQGLEPPLPEELDEMDELIDWDDTPHETA